MNTVTAHNNNLVGIFTKDLVRGDVAIFDPVMGAERVAQINWYELGSTGVNCAHIHLQRLDSTDLGRFVVRAEHEPLVKVTVEG